MGKYKDEDGYTERTRNKLLASIANELAEANKLKRVEIKLTCATNSSINREHNILILKEIEDKA